MRTDRKRGWRSAATLPALFIASFVATYWAITPGASTLAPLAVGAAYAASSADSQVSQPAEPQLLPLPTVVPRPTAPAPTLQELATDNDPGTRQEAQHLLALLDQEQAEGID